MEKGRHVLRNFFPSKLDFECWKICCVKRSDFFSPNPLHFILYRILRCPSWFSVLFWKCHLGTSLQPRFACKYLLQMLLVLLLDFRKYDNAAIRPSAVNSCSARTSSIIFWKNSGELCQPKRLTSYPYVPNWVIKTEHSFDSSVILPSFGK